MDQTCEERESIINWDECQIHELFSGVGSKIDWAEKETLFGDPVREIKKV